MAYIYIRTHESYGNTCKLGKTHNIPERDNQYATGEIKCGYFTSVYLVNDNEVNLIERLLQKKFIKYNIRYDGGTEFYDTIIIDLIELYFIDKEIQYTKLTTQEIEDLKRINRIKNIIPRQDQNEIINKTINYFEENKKGILVLTCGTGKTLISLWIAKIIKIKTLLIGVPNKLLLYQWYDDVKALFEDYKFLIVSSGISKNNIRRFINNHNKFIIMTTYSSSWKITEICKSLSFAFSMKINDEVHHLSTKNIIDKQKRYIKILDIPAYKQLSLTATLKYIDGDINVISNDNINYFGNIIEKRCLLWAINNNIVCDYVVQTVITDKSELLFHLDSFGIKKDINQRLFLAAFCALKSIQENHSHHLLIYSNSQDNSMRLIRYINKLLNNDDFNLPTLFISAYHSSMNSINQKNILNNFKNSEKGIISCVYCLSEGTNMHYLDGVVFSQNMSSNIRILQSSLRASRKNINEPNKITKIILPILNRDDWLEEKNIDLKKVREVIYQMGLEDNTISQKIRVSKISFSENNNKNTTTLLDDYNTELTERLLLKTVKRSALGITYEKAKKIIAKYNLMSKKDYYELCDIDDRLSKEPENIFRNKFINWIDYLGIERNFYDIDECKFKVREYLKDKIELKKHMTNLVGIPIQLCEIDNKFPPYDLWIEYYNISSLEDIIKFPIKKGMVYAF